MRSAQRVLLPSLVLLAGCPQQCGTADPPPAAPAPTAPLAPGVGFVEGFEVAAPVSSRNGSLSTDRFSVSRWRQDWSPGGQADTQGNGPALPGDIRVAGGRLTIESGMQNYGDTLVRVNQPFAGNRIEVDAQLVTVEGGPQLLLTDQPYSAPSFLGENGQGPHMNNGWGLYWQGNGCPLLRRWVNGVQSDHYGDGGSAGPYSCLGTPPTIGVGRLNHVVIDLGSSGMTVSIDGSVVGRYPASPISTGYVMIGTHNHATQKYRSLPTNDSVWDNLTWNGPALAPTRVAQVANSGTRTFGWALPASASTTLTTSALNVGGATQAWLLVDVGTRDSTPTNARLSYQLNGGAVHDVAFQTTNRPANTLLTTTFSIPIDPAELVNGPNTVRLSSAATANLAPAMANIDIVVR